MKNLSTLQKHILIGLLLFLAAAIDGSFIGVNTNYASYLIVFGLMLAIIYVTQYKYIPTLFLGAFIGYTVVGLILQINTPALILLESFFVPLVYIGIAFLFRINYGRKHLDQNDDIKSYAIFFTDTIMTAVIGSFFLSIFYSIILDNTSFVLLFFKQFQFLFLASLTLSLPLLLFYIYKIKLSLQRQLFVTLSVLLFATIYVLLFIPQFHYLLHNFYFIIILFIYLLMAYFFNFLSLVFLNILYLTLSRILYYGIFLDTTVHFDLIAFDAILIVSTAIFIIAKKYTFTIYSQKQRLNEANNKLENMFSSIIGLMQLTEWIDQDHSNHKFEYLEKVFDISCTLFDRFDAFVLAYKSGHVTRFINSKGMPLEVFQQFQPKSSNFIWDTHEPIVYKKPLDNYKHIFGKEFILAKKYLSNINLDVRIPIQTGENNFGALIFLSFKDSEYFIDKQVIKNISLFQQMVNLVYNISALNHKTNSLKDDIVLSLIRTLELFDEYTGSHSEQVADISLHFARKLGLAKDMQTTIYWAGIVHDIGKIGVGYDIVNKTGALTLKEYEAIKKHPVYGFNILSRSEDLKDIALLVKHHHEWYNGNGYPEGLKKDTIPFGSQILCIADAISAMSTKRSYSPVKDKLQIIKELELYSDTQFNPKLVKIAIEALELNELDEYLR